MIDDITNAMIDDFYFSIIRYSNMPKDKILEELIETDQAYTEINNRINDLCHRDGTEEQVERLGEIRDSLWYKLQELKAMFPPRTE